VADGDISIQHRRQKDVAELKKKSSHVDKDFAEIVAELDHLREREFDLKEEIRQCDAAEMTVISDFDEWIVYYNEVAASRMKVLQKRVKEIRKRRAEILKETLKIRPKICLLESRCTALSYKQGEVYWESKLQSVKGRKWVAG
jgi:FtsZ-binding cell division protein ZapB